MKLMVETAGSFMLMIGRKEVPWNRPTVVFSVQQVASQIAIGQLKVLFELPEAADDDEWVKWLAASDNDLELALSSYRAKFTTETELEVPVIVVKKPRGG